MPALFPPRSNRRARQFLVAAVAVLCGVPAALMLWVRFGVYWFAGGFLAALALVALLAFLAGRAAPNRGRIATRQWYALGAVGGTASAYGAWPVALAPAGARAWTT